MTIQQATPPYIEPYRQQRMYILPAYLHYERTHLFLASAAALLFLFREVVGFIFALGLTLTAALDFVLALDFTLEPCM